MADENITLDFLARLGQQTLLKARALRKEVADVRTLSLQTIEYARRIERRMTEQRDDLELMIKAELGGSLAICKHDSKTIFSRFGISIWSWTSWARVSARSSAAYDAACVDAR